MQILFFKCLFFRRFFHSFTIANELTGFSISRLANMEDFFKRHCVKSVQIRIYFWPVFSCIWTNTENDLSVFSPNTGKYGPEITSYLDTFHAVNSSLIIFICCIWHVSDKLSIQTFCFPFHYILTGFFVLEF